MDPLRQIKTWNNQGKWRKIITTVEKIKPAGRDPQMNFILGHAYLRLAHQSDDEAGFRKAIKVLQALEEEFEQDIVWSFDLGTAYFYASQYGKAQIYLNHALRLDPPSDFMAAFEDLMPRIQRNLVFPYFKKNFQSRVPEAWKEFEKKEAKFRQTLDKTTSGKEYDQIVSECRSVLELVFDEPLFYLGKGVDRYILLVMGWDLLQAFEIEYFKQYAPENLLKNWDILVMQPPGFLSREKDFPQISPNQIKVHLVSMGGEIYYLDVYDPKSPKKLGEEREKELNDLKALVLNTTGGIVFQKYFNWSASTADRGSKDITLSELPAFLKEKGIDVDADSYSQLNHEVKYRKYPNSGLGELAPKDLRWDITSGSTKIMKILDDYFGGLSIDIDYLEARGAMAGFFFYRTDQLVKTKDKRRDLKKFRQFFIKELLEKAGADKVTVLGEATGKEQDYIDVLMYDTSTVIDIAAEILRDSPVSLSGYHSFRRFSGSLIFSGEEELKADGFETQFGRTYEYVREADGSVLLPPLTEDENEGNPIYRLLEAASTNF